MPWEAGIQPSNFETMKTRTLNPPNIITLFRVFLVPVIISFVFQGKFGTALLFFLAAGISDVIDGFVARRFNMRTELGATLDPIADKILIVVSVIALGWLGLLPVWLMIVIVCRDLVIAGGALAWHFAIGRVEMAPSLTSKINTFVQVGMILLVLCQASSMVRISSWQPLLFYLVLLTSLVSGIQYVLVWGMKAWNQCRTG